MLAINILNSLCKRYLSAAVGCEFFFSFAYVMFLMIEVTVEHKRPILFLLLKFTHCYIFLVFSFVSSMIICFVFVLYFINFVLVLVCDG